MPDYNFKNNLKSTLQSKLWNDATTISCNHVVESEDADTRRNAWPAFPFTLTVVDTANDNVEVIKCTSLASNLNNVIVFTCERAQETTTARTFEIATTRVEHRLTAGALNAITGSLDEITSNVSESLAQHVGSIISVLATNTYVPLGCVPCDGAEYTRAQFTTLYDIYLTATTPKLLTCTYTEWSTQVGLTGNCAKFAVDTANQKFKVPLLKNGDSITQAASAAELGKSYKAGLPNVISHFTGCDMGSDGTYPTDGAASVVNAVGVQNGGSSGWNSEVSYKFSLQDGNAIYGNSTTVTDEQVRLRHFVVVASAQSNASVFDWSNYMAGLAGKANIDFSNITLAGKVNAGKAMAYALDYEHPVTFSILVDDWVYAPVGGLMVGWVWMDPAAFAQSGVVTVGSTSVAAAARGEGVSAISCIIDSGVRVKKAVGMHAEEVVIVPWRAV